VTGLEIEGESPKAMWLSRNLVLSAPRYLARTLRLQNSFRQGARSDTV